MGENEQGGMLRTVVVVGLVALIAAVITMGVVGMKASMNKNTATAVELTANPDYGKNLLATAERNITFSAGTDQSHWTYNYMYQRVAPLDPGQTYTFSAKVKLQNTDLKNVTVAVYNWYTSPDGRYLSTDDFKTDGSRDSWTFTVPKNISTEKAVLIVYAGHWGKTGGITATYSDMKLEKGSDATPFDFG